MYDIEFVIPISLDKKYLQRLEDFKKIGVVNPADRKVLITLLAGNEIQNSTLPDIEEFICKGWDEGFTVRIHHGGKVNPATKLYSYFSTMKVEARWICKFDDDSCNDVDALVTGLDQEFDSERDYYIVAERRSEQHDIERIIAINNGFQHWFCHNHKEIWHEKEGSIVSARCMQRILDDPAAVKMMADRAEVHDGWGDIMLAYAARAVKVRPSDAFFLSANAEISNYTQFGGNRAHIHFVARDIIDPQAIEILMGPDDALPKQFEDSEWLLREDGGQSLSILRFKQNYQILSKPKIHKASFWMLQENVLKIFDDKINVTSSYNLDKKIMTDIKQKILRLTCL